MLKETEVDDHHLEVPLMEITRTWSRGRAFPRLHSGLIRSLLHSSSKDNAGSQAVARSACAWCQTEVSLMGVLSCFVG